ncbi:NAD(P)-dependent oxidoreductase [uncultured Ilumatobacter sp.]|jgi:3-hydroxyisobutyrate dehydrogenase-like beta-hydroxyacid dehydrogenase|uniref:NAD(P)-dependent oxidoreductase n=1 Tax=uncultured Ilumatobacter sp. TaxID=879968 RepID=UPI00374FAEB1|tara:strand:+ start:157 stop:1002 length:846 start_codon:yes stop_codon:yes gene_type:complete
MTDVVGVVGLGVMGSAMSRHIVAGGYEVRGYDVDTDQMSASAAVAAASVAEVAESCGIVLLSLPTAASLEAVAQEIASVGREDSIVVEMGTLPLEAKAAAAATLHAVGVTMLDAPVSGTGLQAADATLVVYCSGPSGALNRVRPVFDLIARQTYDLGEFGNGSRMKFVANLLVAVQTLAAAEAHSLGAAAGLAPSVVQEVIGAGVGSSRMFDIRGPMMVSEQYEPPSARLSIILKDAGIISDFARATNAATPLLDATIPLYERGVRLGLGDVDAAVLRKLF